MESKFNYYIDRVICKIGCDRKMEKHIREDLYNMLLEKEQAEGIDDPYKLLGNPDEVAKEFRENLSLSDNNQFPMWNMMNNIGCNYEYISKTRIHGIPLIHANLKPFGFTKGIISIGTFPVGVIALGAIPFGILSFGGVAFGLLSALGGAAVSAGISIGGFALSYFMSFGGCAIAHYLAFGGFAMANIAVGGVTKGTISVFNQSGTGKYLFKVPYNSEKVINAIKKVYPGIGNKLIDMIKFLISIDVR